MQIVVVHSDLKVIGTANLKTKVNKGDYICIDSELLFVNGIVHGAESLFPEAAQVVVGRKEVVRGIINEENSPITLPKIEAPTKPVTTSVKSVYIFEEPKPNVTQN